MNNKEREILEKYFNIDDSELNCIELEAWTNGGVDMLIYFDSTNKHVADALEEYIDNFDIDEEIDMYRQQEDYRDAFTIRESLEDFTNWITFIKNIIKELRGDGETI